MGKPLRVQVSPCPQKTKDMRIVFIFGGKKGAPETETLVTDYCSRIERSFPVDIKYFSSSKKGDEVLREENVKILEEISESDYVLLCDERGKQVTSPEYSEILGRMVASGKKRVVIIVGGAYGVTDAVRQRADLTIALSRMVFPHELARVMVCEQTYRALSIIKGSQYHHV